MRHLAFVGIVLITTTLAHAQTGPALVLMPWTDGVTSEVDFAAAYFGEGHVRQNSMDINLQRYSAAGRTMIDPENLKLSIGGELDYLNIDTTDAGLPERLADASISVGMPVNLEIEGWSFAATAGVGFAGDTPLSDGDAWYAMATFIATLEIDDQSSLQIMLDYNGNRSIIPDIPLPAIAYSRRSSDSLRYTVGIPYSNLVWKITEQVTLDVNYAVPFSVNATLDYAVIEELSLFASFLSTFNGYHLEGDSDTRRLFFRQRRIEGGATWHVNNMIDVTVAGGFAFDQSFKRGFDTRSTVTVRDISDMPYIRAAVELEF